MAIFGKDRERNERTRLSGYEGGTPQAVPSGAEFGPLERPAASSALRGPNAFLGKGTRVSGKLSFEGPAHVDGHVDGEILAADTLTIGESAVVTAQIVGGAVVIHGKVTGDVTAKRRLEIRAPGVLIGNINTPSLVIHEGVVFEGLCSMGTAPEAQRGEKDRKLSVVSKDDRSGEPGQRKLSEAGT